MSDSHCELVPKDETEILKARIAELESDRSEMTQTISYFQKATFAGEARIAELEAREAKNQIEWDACHLRSVKMNDNLKAQLTAARAEDRDKRAAGLPPAPIASPEETK